MKKITLKSNSFFSQLISNTWFIVSLLAILTLIITIQNCSSGVNHFWGGDFTHYNNYVIFKQSYPHLIANKNLYLLYLDEYADLYKYSPTFAFFMFFFNWFPDAIGLFLWNALNVFVLYYAISKLKVFETKQKTVLILFILFELILSTQNSQSNALLAGLSILSFNQFEKGKPIYACLFIALGAYIKIYSIITCLLIFFYPKKIKSMGALAFWFSLLFLVPLLRIDFSHLLHQYQNWYELLKTDQNESIGMSVFLFVNKLFSTNLTKIISLGIGLIILISPLFFIKKYQNSMFRNAYLALLLIWMVIFNHKAESPTYIIALVGVGIWYFISDKNTLHKILFFGTLLFSSLWFTDIIPRTLKNNFPDARYIKTLFPMLILFLLFFQLLFSNRMLKTEANNEKQRVE